jgi:hypothetical protein
MFHTLDSVNKDQVDPEVSSTTAKSTPVVEACEVCRRRKLRCDGKLPCGSCQWFRRAASCRYSESRNKMVLFNV